MVILRATQKVLKSIPGSLKGEGSSDTALGDWYVNRVVVDRRPLLLFVSSKSLLAVLAPARNVKTLPGRLSTLISERLRRPGIEDHLIVSEMRVMQDVQVGSTQDRSVTGTMVDFAKALPYYLPIDGWSDSELQGVEDRLSETPCRCSRSHEETIWPFEVTHRLLKERWQ